MAIWYMKHASALTANANVSEDEAKIIFKSLRKAAGLFKFAQVNYFGRLQNQPAKGSDLDPRVSNAYHLQCLAEAQEGELYYYYTTSFITLPACSPSLFTHSTYPLDTPHSSINRHLISNDQLIL